MGATPSEPPYQVVDRPGSGLAPLADWRDGAARPVLTATEWLVLARLARGESDEEIAVALRSLPRAIRRTLARIYRALPLGAAGNQRVAAAVWLVRHGASRSVAHRAGIPHLGAAQWLVLDRLACGESNKQIAAGLGLVPQTVKNHLGRVYPRLPLGVVAHQRVAAAVWYVRVGGRPRQEEQGSGDVTAPR